MTAGRLVPYHYGSARLATASTRQERPAGPSPRSARGSSRECADCSMAAPPASESESDSATHHNRHYRIQHLFQGILGAKRWRLTDSYHFSDSSRDPRQHFQRNAGIVQAREPRLARDALPEFPLRPGLLRTAELLGRFALAQIVRLSIGQQAVVTLTPFRHVPAEHNAGPESESSGPAKNISVRLSPDQKPLRIKGLSSSLNAHA